jgi:hypothetical protein
VFYLAAQKQSGGVRAQWWELMEVLFWFPDCFFYLGELGRRLLVAVVHIWFVSQEFMC